MKKVLIIGIILIAMMVTSCLPEDLAGEARRGYSMRTTSEKAGQTGLTGTGRAREQPTRTVPTRTDRDGDGFSTTQDCNDNNANINPGANEIYCNNIDENCNPADDWGTDSDGDGYALEGGACGIADCDDTNPQVNPGMTEIPGDGLDNDCNSNTPDGVPSNDADGDGYPIPQDCDDTNPFVNPGMPEVPGDGLDNDCDPNTPDGVPSGNDNDNDGFFTPQDCDDTNPMINPGMPEIMGNGLDDDCDPNTPDTVTPIDNDNDGYDTTTDCDDNNAQINPGMTEILGNGIDDDCNSATPDVLPLNAQCDSNNECQSGNCCTGQCKLTATGNNGVCEYGAEYCEPERSRVDANFNFIGDADCNLPYGANCESSDECMSTYCNTNGRCDHPSGQQSPTAPEGGSYPTYLLFQPIVAGNSWATGVYYSGKKIGTTEKEMLGICGMRYSTENAQANRNLDFCIDNVKNTQVIDGEIYAETGKDCGYKVLPCPFIWTANTETAPTIKETTGTSSIGAIYSDKAIAGASQNGKLTNVQCLGDDDCAFPSRCVKNNQLISNYYSANNMKEDDVRNAYDYASLQFEPKYGSKKYSDIFGACTYKQGTFDRGGSQ